MGAAYWALMLNYTVLFLVLYRLQIALILVGLPARGKTHTAQKLRRFLRWLGIKCEIFDVGHLRRDTYGAQPSADFFDHGARRAQEETASS